MSIFPSASPIPTSTPLQKAGKQRSKRALCPMSKCHRRRRIVEPQNSISLCSTAPTSHHRVLLVVSCRCRHSSSQWSAGNSVSVGINKRIPFPITFRHSGSHSSMMMIGVEEEEEEEDQWACLFKIFFFPYRSSVFFLFVRGSE